MVVSRGKRVRGWKRVKGAKYIMTEHDLTLAGGHTMQYIDHVS